MYNIYSQNKRPSKYTFLSTIWGWSPSLSLTSTFFDLPHLVHANMLSTRTVPNRFQPSFFRTSSILYSSSFDYHSHDHSYRFRFLSPHHTPEPYQVPSRVTPLIHLDVLISATLTLSSILPSATSKTSSPNHVPWLVSPRSRKTLTFQYYRNFLIA